MSTTEVTPLVVKGLIERFPICWEAWPEYPRVGQEKRQIGFALDLYGAHEEGTEHSDPGLEERLRELGAPEHRWSPRKENQAAERRAG